MLSDFFAFFLVPLVTIIFIFFLKISSKKKDDIRNEDKAVGFEILIGNISVIFIEMINTVIEAAKHEATKIDDTSSLSKLLTLICLVGLLSLLSVFLSFLIRKNGWNDDGTLKNWAVTYPNIVGLLTQSVVWMILTKS